MMWTGSTEVKDVPRGYLVVRALLFASIAVFAPGSFAAAPVTLQPGFAPESDAGPVPQRELVAGLNLDQGNESYKSYKKSPKKSSKGSFKKKKGTKTRSKPVPARFT